MSPSDQVKQSILETETLSSTPLLLSKLYRVLQDPNVHLDDINSLIHSDPGLISDVIRIANSALYGPHAKHTRLDSALRTIGLRRYSGLSV